MRSVFSWCLLLNFRPIPLDSPEYKLSDLSHVTLVVQEFESMMQAEYFGQENYSVILLRIHRSPQNLPEREDSKGVK